MTGATEIARRPTIDEFITLFLCGIVLRERRYIHVRSALAAAERRRMQALYEYVADACEKCRKEEDKDYLHFLLRLRNQLAPSPIGSFDGFLGLLSSRQATYICVNLPFCQYYTVEIRRVTARSIVDRTADSRLKALADGAAAAYAAPLQKPHACGTNPDAGPKASHWAV